MTGTRRWRLAAGLIVSCGLLAVAGAAAPWSTARDIGRIEITLKPLPPAGKTISQRDVERSLVVMRSRLARLGAHGTITHSNGSQLVVLHVRGLSRAAALQVAKSISQPGQLDFYDLEPSLLHPSIDTNKYPVATTSLFTLLKRAQTRDHGLPSAAYLFRSSSKQVVAGPVAGPATRAQLTKTLLARYHGSQPPNTEVLTVPARAAILTCSAGTSIVCPGLDAMPAPRLTYYYLVKDDPSGRQPAPAMTGHDLRANRTRQSFDPATGTPIVTIQFTHRGAKRFHQITRAEAQRGQALAAPQHFAIVLDNQIRSWPQIDYDKYPDGIDPTGSGAEITGLSSLAEARRLATTLVTGTLPLRFTISG